MSIRTPSHAAATAWALLVTVLWSSSWILIRWGLDDAALDPLTFAALRYGLAGALLVGVVVTRPRLRRHVVDMNRGTVRRVLVLGIVFYAVTQGAQFVAIDEQPAATTSLVLSWTPALVALASGWSLGEAPSVRQIGGSALVALGAFLYFAGDLGATAAGMVAASIGLVANASSALLGRSVNRDDTTPAIVVTSLSMSVGAALLVVAGVIVEGIPQVSAGAWGIIAWLAVVNTALAFTLWNLSMRRLSAIESAGINNTMLVQIALLGWVFLDEAPGVASFVGIAIVSLGVVLTQAGARRRVSARP